MNQKVHAPYHFVPLSRWVYMPEWAHLVSHDHPFEDGHSGVIEYTLTNHTPLSVGDEKDEQGNLKFAKDPMGNPVIPGSSLKGMLRSVLEIATFGKFNSFDDQRFSFRKIGVRGTYTNIRNSHDTQAGWIKFDPQSQQWMFTPCNFAKIAHRDLNSNLALSIRNQSSSIYKYSSLPLVTDVSAKVQPSRNDDEEATASNVRLGGDGSIVFSNFRFGSGKPQNFDFSYYFYPKSSKDCQPVNRQVSELFINHTNVTEEIDKIKYDQVSYLRENPHPKNGIPVFAFVNKHTGLVRSLGFAKLPRISYKFSTQEMVKRLNSDHLSEKCFDFSELMFGGKREEGMSIKSRVFFSDATSKSNVKDSLYFSHPIVSSSPKPTFYPAYVEQPDVNKAKRDYQNKSSVLSGHKRYIAKQPYKDDLQCNKIKNTKVAQSIQLLPRDNIFSGRVVFHNLKTIELAALIWTLKLQEGGHQLGHGKPFGAGVVTMSPSFLKSKTLKFSISELVEIFEEHMQSQYPDESPNAWRESPQIEYLFAIGALGSNENLDTSYMDLKAYSSLKDKHRLEPLHGLTRKESGAVRKASLPEVVGRGRLKNLFSEEGGKRTVSGEQTKGTDSTQSLKTKTEPTKKSELKV
ncbi:TIGR03986 family CRISPR-associated RAMP protein [Vibrio breoganii]|uniref:TIGR03986 family type III CRISPR-associated RAMP protein n=1 Tax=Vibrio breoganii TaxID=553239 RepID=UPI0010BD1D5D|nr:TIGR03986 family CRISPR-associated RAMP protein [Vibrio breoganii]TKF84869.1 TIGR03986 family CRISPR-associated RAMP protein [Vibrio breoganii]